MIRPSGDEYQVEDQPWPGCSEKSPLNSGVSREDLVLKRISWNLAFIYKRLSELHNRVYTTTEAELMRHLSGHFGTVSNEDFWVFDKVDNAIDPVCDRIALVCKCGGVVVICPRPQRNAD